MIIVTIVVFTCTIIVYYIAVKLLWIVPLVCRLQRHDSQVGMPYIKMQVRGKGYLQVRHYCTIITGTVEGCMT